MGNMSETSAGGSSGSSAGSAGSGAGSGTPGAPGTPQSVEEHLADILNAVRGLEAHSVTLADALGRTLAEDVTALVAIPGFDNSGMDGYAVRRDDLLAASDHAPVTLTVVADLAAGTSANPSLSPGTAARIMTGAPVPDGADAVVPIEHTDTGTDHVAIRTCPAIHAHIRRAGTDAQIGDHVLSAGDTITARHISSAASVGRSELRVIPAPRVGVISTGSELVPPGHPLAHGQIHDSNSYLLSAAVAEAGGVPVNLGPVPDDEDAFRELIARNAGRVDAFVLSGGVSVGAYDVVKAVLSRLGTVEFNRVRMQPGKPQAFGRWNDGTPIFGLPGNPVSAFVSFEVFVRPALRKMQGCRELERPRMQAIAGVGWRCPPGRRQYMPVTVQSDATRPDATRPEVATSDVTKRDVARASERGGMRVRPAAAGGSGSHLVASLAAAQALAIVDETIEEVREGDTVDVMLLS